MGRAADGALARSTAALDRAAGRVEAGGRAHLRTHEHAVAAAAARLAQRPPRLLAAAERELAPSTPRCGRSIPGGCSPRGWSITRTADGRTLRSAADAAPGDELVTTLADGSVRSTVSADPAPADPAPGSTR